MDLKLHLFVSNVTACDIYNNTPNFRYTINISCKRFQYGIHNEIEELIQLNTHEVKCRNSINSL